MTYEPFLGASLQTEDPLPEPSWNEVNRRESTGIQGSLDFPSWVLQKWQFHWTPQGRKPKENRRYFGGTPTKDKPTSTIAN